MNDRKNCLCQLFKYIRPGTILAIKLIEQSEIMIMFYRIHNDCIYGKTTSGDIIISCHQIISVSCSIPCSPAISINNPGPISCNGELSGMVSCAGLGLPGVTVNLTSNPSIIIFSNPTPVTDENGEFSTNITIPPQMQPTPVTITATIICKGKIITNNITTTVECITCQNPVLKLYIPIILNCEDKNLYGLLTCDGIPIPGALVSFEITPDDFVVVVPNPTTTDTSGNYTAKLTPLPGASGNYTIQASSTVGGNAVTSPTINFTANCPIATCICKVKLGTSGKNQPPATMNVNGTILIGMLNITVLECGASINQPCNPAIDNFNFEFNASNGTNFQFTQGRRSSLTCNNNTATLVGVIQGSINNGPKTTYNVTINATINTTTNEITWIINATDGTNTFSTASPYTADGSPNSFIADCP